MLLEWQLVCTVNLLLPTFSILFPTLSVTRHFQAIVRLSLSMSAVITLFELSTIESTDIIPDVIDARCFLLAYAPPEPDRTFVFCKTWCGNSSLVRKTAKRLMIVILLHQEEHVCCSMCVNAKR